MNGLWDEPVWIWPAHPQPISDELLSSWMVRLAHANGCKVHTFYSMEFGRDRQIWNRDIDRLAPDWLVEGLAIRTKISKDRVINISLRSYDGVVYEKHNAQGNTKWILPLGIYHRTRRRKGMQYCPVCLATDDIPYFRKHWRLAFYTECDIHGVLLRDACTKCMAPVIFHRTELGKRHLIKPLSISHCFNCGEHLASGPIHTHVWSSWELQQAFKSLLTFHFLGWAFVERLQVQYSHLLFD